MGKYLIAQTMEEKWRMAKVDGGVLIGRILKGRTDPFDMLPNIRYDKVFEPMGVHTEHVETPAQIIPALERALGSARVDPR
jgi:hypothetical protein